MFVWKSSRIVNIIGNLKSLKGSTNLLLILNLTTLIVSLALHVQSQNEGLDNPTFVVLFQCYDAPYVKSFLVGLNKNLYWNCLGISI